MNITTSPAKRLELLEVTHEALTKAIMQCKAEISMLRATTEPELPQISSPYATFSYHRHARNHSEV